MVKSIEESTVPLVPNLPYPRSFAKNEESTKEVIAIKKMKFMKTSVRLGLFRIKLWPRKKFSS
jgi:hypothetical protein